METLSNAAGSYTMPKMHVFERTEGGGRLRGDEHWYEKKHKQFEETVKEDLKRIEDSNIKESGLDTFKDTKVSYVTKEGEVLKEESDVEIPVGDHKLSKQHNEHIKYVELFGKRYEGNVANLNNDILSKIKEADKVLEKNGEKYHKLIQNQKNMKVLQKKLHLMI